MPTSLDSHKNIDFFLQLFFLQVNELNLLRPPRDEINLAIAGIHIFGSHHIYSTDIFQTNAKDGYCEFLQSNKFAIFIDQPTKKNLI
jgi:hypothetical protein